MADATPNTHPSDMEQAFAECLATLDTMIHAEREAQFAGGNIGHGAADPALAVWEEDAEDARTRLHLAFHILFNIEATTGAEALFSHLGYALEAVVMSEVHDEFARMRAFAEVGLEMAPLLLGSGATETRMGLVSEAQRLVEALARLDHYRGPDNGGPAPA